MLFDIFGSILVHEGIFIILDRFLLSIFGYSFIPSLATELIEPALSPLLTFYTSKYPQLRYHRGNLASCLKTPESVICVVFDKHSTAPSMPNNIVDFLQGHNVLFHLIDDSLVHGFRLRIQMKAPSPPSIALMAKVSGKIQIMGRFSLLSKAVTSAINECLEKIYFEWAAAIAKEEERRSERALREEQDAAYQKSLAADQAKEQLRKRITIPIVVPDESITNSKKISTPIVTKKKIQRSCNPLEAEPSEGLKFSFQLSTGMRLTRKFSPSEPCSHLYDFVSQSHDKDFSIRTLIPPSIVPDSTDSISAILINSQRLIVEDNKE